MAGKVYIVGVGPGDPKLITLKALECIKKADVLIYDRLVNQKILKYARADAEFIDVGKMPDFHAVPQAEINNLVIAEACSGKTVVRVKGGDPFVFGRGGEEAEILSDTGIDFEIVPGISSAISVPAYAGIPVTHRDYCSSFHVITGHEKPDKAESWLDYRELAKLSGTLVFLMGIKNLPDICKNLILHGRDENTPVAVIEKGTTSRQRIVTGTLDNIVSKVSEADIQSPAVTVIGDVVRLKDRLHWYPKGPLAGKRIVVTRSREQASELIEQIEALGAEAIEFPTIKVVPPYRWGAFDQVLENISGFHWIVFTSTNGVKGFFNRLKEKGLDIRQLYGVKLCAVGAATQAELVNLGLRIDFVPKTFTTKELLDGLIPQIKTGEKVLLARADIASPVLSDGLKERNIPVEDLVVYHTIPDSSEKANIVNLLTNNQVDFITFTSSSTVQHFVSMIGAGNISLANRCKIVCIGPVTAKTATAFGLTVTAIADQYTIDGLVEKLTRINLI
jgi:uroporphyrinogen III methyltransferase/synthase